MRLHLAGEAGWGPEWGCKAKRASEENGAAESWNQSPGLSDHWNRGTTRHPRFVHLMLCGLGILESFASLGNNHTIWFQNHYMVISDCWKMFYGTMKVHFLEYFSEVCCSFLRFSCSGVLKWSPMPVFSIVTIIQSDRSVMSGPKWRTTSAESCFFGRSDNTAAWAVRCSLKTWVKSVATARCWIRWQGK